jgi:hypothetical protein
LKRYLLARCEDAVKRSQYLKQVQVLAFHKEHDTPFCHCCRADPHNDLCKKRNSLLHLVPKRISSLLVSKLVCVVMIEGQLAQDIAVHVDEL